MHDHGSDPSSPSPPRNDLHHYQLENSYSVRVIEPMKRLHMSFHDEQRHNHVELDYTAVTEGILFNDGNDYEQGLRVKGTLAQSRG